MEQANRQLVHYENTPCDDNRIGELPVLFHESAGKKSTQLAFPLTKLQRRCLKWRDCARVYDEL